MRSTHRIKDSTHIEWNLKNMNIDENALTHTILDLTKQNLRLTYEVLECDIHYGHGQIYSKQMLNSCNRD